MSAANEQQDLKREKIIEASYQRFLHYGYSKTTMNEIAGDLSMSKALLYYYFPDKSELYMAVMRKLANDYLKQLEDKAGHFTDLREAFLFQVNTHHDFIVNNYNFFDFFRLNEQNLPDTIWETVSQIRSAEITLLADVIQTRVEKNNLKPIAPPLEIVEVFLDALHGIKVGGVLQSKKLNFPHREDLDEIHKKRLLLIDVFVKGLN
ncbi:TetR/AcrR family transcriptional regulator [Mucilaginibacter phyllosphaerae]|uniref:TetR/AcrR family transcriptional regulator n=1 Tax=Mucilaginibacter phyllosphaerae TaxID=1812349 RepID=A0A4Y8ACC7_9SPHI|nr:TetR/AcrR family transcriptional regulator [Mucilaginibacter phyllosphaerae]MBB3969083.1 TetR/AcrR family transcriptional repressor of mexJK operon [Mucilaginibacter phyllosphaerae]TEW66100.1 TetR/AcrR family transcriptional regulator [Mucilaginibacter phyllosphaerae]GGH06132.1 TetR family transcriptional regulator [Mucilaginibacter phyllosphaerae]